MKSAKETANKSAKEMFEELGYLKSTTNNLIEYQNEYRDEEYVDFYRKEKYYNCGLYLVDMPLHKAIQKQLEELGWLDE